MSDYIKREAAIAAAFSANGIGNSEYRNVCDIAERLRLIPAADVVEQKAGKWETEICDDGYGAYNLYKCDQCGDLSAQPRNYCRECGARMVSE